MKNFKSLKRMSWGGFQKKSEKKDETKKLQVSSQDLNSLYNDHAYLNSITKTQWVAPTYPPSQTRHLSLELRQKKPIVESKDDKDIQYLDTHHSEATSIRGSMETPRMSPGTSSKNSLIIEEDDDITVDLCSTQEPTNNRRSFRFVKALNKLGPLTLPPPPPLPSGHEHLKPTVTISIQTPTMLLKTKTTTEITVERFVSRLRQKLPGETANYQLSYRKEVLDYDSKLFEFIRIKELLYNPKDVLILDFKPIVM